MTDGQRVALGATIACALLANLYFVRAALRVVPGASSARVLLWEKLGAPRERFTAEGWRLRQIALRWLAATAAGGLLTWCLG